MDDYNAAVPDTLPGGQVIHTESLHQLVAATPVLLVDVLPIPRRPPAMQQNAPWMPLPRRNLPGSLWLPETGRGALSPAMEAWFDQELMAAAEGDRTRAVVFYCRAMCWMSWNAAKRAIAHGWTHVLWYPEGPDAWAAAGLPLAESHPPPMP